MTPAKELRGQRWRSIRDTTGYGRALGILQGKAGDDHCRGGQKASRTPQGGQGTTGNRTGRAGQLCGHNREAGKGDAPEKLQLTVKPKVGWLFWFVRCWDPCSGDTLILFVVAVTAVW